MPYRPLPDFSQIDIPALPAQLQDLLDDCRVQVAALLAGGPDYHWDNLLAPLEQLDDRVDKFWSPVSHLHGVMNSDELREAYNACIPLLSAYQSEMGQNRALFEAVKSVRDGAVYGELSRARQQTVDNLLRDFRLSGVDLEEAARQRFAGIQQRLSELATAFSNQLLDATGGWELVLADAGRLAGVPDMALQNLRQSAEARELAGYRLTLDVPAYLPVMQYADDRSLREELYTAYSTRASEQGPQAGQWDNGPLMVEILQLRQELAHLLGFASYAERSLTPKMAQTPQQVLDFLGDLAVASLPQARREYAELSDFARSQGCDDLRAWDVPYFSEKLREQNYAVSQEELRPYFPVNKVIEGLFAVTGRLFGIRFESDDSADLWHPDARCFQVFRGAEQIATCYMDLYARDRKRGGAWMADYCGRMQLGERLQKPVAFLTCNFSQPTRERPSLLTHNEVTTLFHEFGHGLHHMLTEIDVLSVSGIAGVAWDAVELPSQFLENWCWEPEVIPLISGHFDSGEPLPGALLDKLLAARNFQSGMQMMRQLEFALFDMTLHMMPAPAAPEQIQSVLDGVREQVAVYPVPAFNRFQHGFSHIFAGGYAAGYYSYKWAEVLSADAFSLFEEEGVMNAGTGQKFLNEILSKGGSEDAMVLFRRFRGREPSVAALLRHSGIDSDREVA